MHCIYCIILKLNITQLEHNSNIIQLNKSLLTYKLTFVTTILRNVKNKLKVIKY